MQVKKYLLCREVISRKMFTLVDIYTFVLKEKRKCDFKGKLHVIQIMCYKLFIKYVLCLICK